MTIREIANILNARIVVDVELDRQIKTGCGADLMSDVLAFLKEDSVILTGLVNQHVIRTAEMIDVGCIVFVRGKPPTQDLIELAKQRGIAILTTKDSMFAACGKLYQAGLSACEGAVDDV